MNSPGYYRRKLVLDLASCSCKLQVSDRKTLHRGAWAEAPGLIAPLKRKRRALIGCRGLSLGPASHLQIVHPRCVPQETFQRISPTARAANLGLAAPRPTGTRSRPCVGPLKLPSLSVSRAPQMFLTDASGMSLTRVSCEG